MPKQEPTTNDPPILIPFVGSPDARPASPILNRETDEILSRLDLCGELVDSELEAYRNSMPSDGVETSRDVLLSVVIPVYNEENTLSLIHI